MQPEPHPDLARLTGPDRRRFRPGLGTLVAVIAAGVVAGMIALWPTGEVVADLGELGLADQAYRAGVVAVVEGPCSYAEEFACRTVTFQLEEGPEPGTRFVQEFEAELASSPEFEVGERVVLYYLPDAPEEYRYQFADRDRRAVLITLTALFVLAVAVLGRGRGVAALGGLVASVVVVVAFIVPSILEGNSPVLVAAVGAGAIGLLALYLAHGVTPMTHVAVLGTLAALVLTVVLSEVAIEAARFSGFATEESLYLSLAGDIDISGLLLAGIVLGALGALDDVTVTQASTVWEVRRVDPTRSASALFSSGLTVGRDHIASAVNTLLLASPVSSTWSTRVVRNPDEMGFRMLLGRQAIRRRFVVDPGRSFLGKTRRRTHAMNIGILSRDAALYSTHAPARRGRGTRSHRRRRRLPPLLHEHHLGQAQGALQGRGVDVRRRDPPHRGHPHPLRGGRGPPVRDDGVYVVNDSQGSTAPETSCGRCSCSPAPGWGCR
jgi:hypothetical protein